MEKDDISLWLSNEVTKAYISRLAVARGAAETAMCNAIRAGDHNTVAVNYGRYEGLDLAIDEPQRMRAELGEEDET